MRLGILVPSIGAFGAKGFYNLQEVGLAKALAPFFEEIKVWRLIPKGATYSKESLAPNVSFELLPSGAIGANGIVPFEKLDAHLDALILFSDNQLSVPKIFKWTKKHGIRLFPYVGVCESHSTSSLKRKIMDILFERNLRVYRACHSFAKNSAVEKFLKDRGAKKVTVATVGLDEHLLKTDWESYDPKKLKEKYGFSSEDQVLLFIGRLTPEKEPIRMLKLMNTLPEYKLFMVGTGELSDEVDAFIKENNLSNRVKRLDKVPNQDIWELYRFADTFVNLNRGEIFGMAILEAMYYGCKVVAHTAPGPDMIIENGISGHLANSLEEIVEKIQDETPVAASAHQRIQDEFMWTRSAEKIYSVIGEES